MAPRRAVLSEGPRGPDQAKPATTPSEPEPPTVIDREGNEYVQQ